MATSPVTEMAATSASGSQDTVATFALCIPPMPADAQGVLIEHLAATFPSEKLLIASPDQGDEEDRHDGAVRLVPYPVHRDSGDWVLNASDYLAAGRLAQQRNLTGVMLLGTEAISLRPDAVRALREAMDGGADLAVPRYNTTTHQGLVNSALLYPMSRALFGLDVRFPLPLDAALSQRMLARLTGLAQRAANDSGLVWPVAEASLSGFSVKQVEGVERSLPRPQETDLNVLFPAVASSLFADVEAKAAYWQRARPLARSAPRALSASTPEAGDPEEVRSLAEGFRLAFSNLRDIWSLVLPPQSLLALKRLSLTPAETFVFPHNLWARVVYDFALAFHARTINRGHLLGAMTPLYLAWVAGLLGETAGVASEGFVEATAKAFEQEKPYLVSRWRWPDRFNP